MMRFGAEYVESALAAQGRKLIVADNAELEDDLVQDMIEVLTSLCARLYGRRSAKNNAKEPWRPSRMQINRAYRYELKPNMAQ